MELKKLLVEQMQDLLHAENQLTTALPKMAGAANNPALRELFEVHLVQTRGQIDRLKAAFEIMGEEAKPKPCKGMEGLIKEGQETIEENGERDPLAADLALIAAAQRVEHYEIAGYGNVRCLARQLGLYDVAELMTQTLGEEESSDHLLTAVTKPILQDLSIKEGGQPVNLASLPSLEDEQPKRKRTPAHA